MGKTYFAADGTYGDAEGLLVVDTTDWDEDDWAAVDYTTDSARLEIARQLVGSKDQQV